MHAVQEQLSARMVAVCGQSAGSLAELMVHAAWPTHIPVVLG